MGRKTIDCRDYPVGDVKCTVSISADTIVVAEVVPKKAYRIRQEGKKIGKEKKAEKLQKGKKLNPKDANPNPRNAHANPTAAMTFS